MDSTLLSREDAWLNELYSEALEQATEFSDSCLDQAFSEISARLNAIRAGSNPAFFRNAVKAQRIQLQLLHAELEHHSFSDEATCAESESFCSQPAADSSNTSDASNTGNTKNTSKKARFELASQQTQPYTEAGDVRLADSLFEAVNDDSHLQNSRPLAPHAVAFSDQYASDNDSEIDSESETGRVSRVPNVQQFMAIQANGEVLHVDPVGIAQAWIEMYLDNERALKARQERQLAKQKRQFQLIAGFISAAILVIYAAVVIYLDVSNKQEHMREYSANAAASNIPVPASSEPLLPYQSVNARSAANTYTPISGEVRNELNASQTPNNTQEHPAQQVGINEFSYFDETMYEPDRYADADVEYYPSASEDDPVETYPEAISGSSITVDKRESATSLLEQAYAHWHAGNIAEAQQAYLNVLASDPKDTEALVGLGSMAQRAGNTAAAIDYLVRAVKIQADHPYALAALASLSTNENRAELERDLMTLARKNPGIAELPFILGNWYARAKRWPDAQQAYFDAYNRNSLNADYAYNLAIALDQIGKSTTAESYYRKAIMLAADTNTHFDIEKARARADQIVNR